jgi:hypothetical protein
LVVTQRVFRHTARRAGFEVIYHGADEVGMVRR